MRKVFLFMMTSLDGYFEGEDHDLSWHNVDNEFSDFANRQLSEVDTLIFGSRTYELMENFWPTEQAIIAEPVTAAAMTSLHKIVFSHNPIKTNWENTEASTNPVDYLKSLKSQPGKDIAVLGSSNLCITLLKHHLLDELRIMINPVILGKGTALFDGLDKPIKFKLASSQQFKSGNVLLKYTVA